MKPVRGNVPAVVTPFSEGGDLMVDQLQALIEWHLVRGAEAICVVGDNGESWSLTLDERRQIAQAAVAAVAGRVPVLVGTSATTARQSIEYAALAAEAGADALMVGPQAYVGKASTAELVARFRAVHAAVPLPVVVYNSPRRTGINLEPDQLAALCEVVPVIGLKEASRDFFHVTAILERFAERLCVFIGPCPMILWGIAAGAGGFISSGPELWGAAASRIASVALAAPGEEYRRLHFGLTRIYATLMGTGTWPAALKAALGLVGAPAGLPREPVLPLSGPDRAKLVEVMRELGLLDGPAAAREA